MSQGIYAITNSMTGNVYIGRDSNLPKRWSGHKYNLKMGTHINPHLQASYNKHGLQGFLYHEIVCGPFGEDDLVELEQFYMDKYRAEGVTLYNVTDARNTRAGLPTAVATKKKISKTLMGHNVSDEARIKMAASKVGKPSPRKGASHSEMSKAKNAAAHRGKKISEETRLRMSLSQSLRRQKEAQVTLF